VRVRVRVLVRVLVRVRVRVRALTRMFMHAADNEEHNCRTVSTLGVHCVYTPRGMTEVVCACVRARACMSVTAWCVCVRACAYVCEFWRSRKTRGFLKTKPLSEGWVGGWGGGGFEGWVEREGKGGWVDRWAEREGKGGV
jgi:hypothetical protein